MRQPLILWMFVALSAVGSAHNAAAKGTKPPPSSTVPLLLEDNRVFVELSFRRPNGIMRKARAWVDTGGGWFAMTEGLAQELGLSRTGDEITSEDQRAVPVTPPNVALGAFPLDLTMAHPYAILGVKRIEPGINAEVFLPARVLMHYHAVFDYPARTFTLARPGALKPRGQRVPSPIDPKSGFPRIELSVDGKTYGFLLDTGAAYTMISRELLEGWAGLHTDWRRLTGAVGEANMLGDQMDTDALLLRLPALSWGPIQLHDVGTVSRRVGIFETSMSKWMTAPIVGAIAGNVLKTLRVEIDYPNGITFLEQVGKADANDLDSVGIIFNAEQNGSYRVTGIARKDERQVLEGVQAGDQLLSVDRLIVTDASRDTVIHSMQGRPGETHKLRLLRNGKEFELEAVVQHLL